MSGVMSRCDRMAENADTRGIERVNYLAPLALGTFYFLCAFPAYLLRRGTCKTIIDVLPQRLIDGLGVAGGIMPAIGFAVLLKIMMKNVYIPYFILGLCCRSRQVTGAGYCCRCAGDGADRPAA